MPSGSGVSPHQLIAPEQGISGSFSERDDLTSPRATADSRYGYDQRPRNMRQRRLAHDQRAAPSIEQRHANHADILTRFPMARKNQLWG